MTAQNGHIKCCPLIAKNCKKVRLCKLVIYNLVYFSLARISSMCSLSFFKKKRVFVVASDEEEEKSVIYLLVFHRHFTI